METVLEKEIWTCNAKIISAVVKDDMKSLQEARAELNALIDKALKNKTCNEYSPVGGE
jgi:hypothetical protein